MIKIQKTDTIIDILGKMKEQQWDDIILAFPFWHPILHNYLSLKIIKNRSWTKNLLIVTSDQTSRKIGKHLGIKYSFIKDDKFYDEESTKQKILKHNFTFWEYFRFEVKHFFKDIWDGFTENKSVKYYSLKYSKEQGKIGYFVFWLLFSAFVLFLIFYFAVTKTYITITPEITIKTRGKNFIFREMENQEESVRENLIQLRKVSKVLYLEDTYATTGIDESQVKKSKWKVTLFNKYPEEVKLLPKTRLQTATWVLLELDTTVVIPAAYEFNGKLTPGSTEISATSQVRDSFGKLAGELANVPKDTPLTLPGLKDGKDMLYATTSTDFDWAEEFKDRFVISQQDIENSKKVLEERLKSQSFKELQAEIKKENELNNVTFEILWIEDIIRYSDFTANIIDGSQVWDVKNKFKIGGSIKIETYIFNKDAVISKLKTIITDTILEWSEQLLSISNDSLRASTIVYKQDNPFEVKATMEIESFIVHNFLNENDAYVKRLKSIIMGLTEEEAQKILLNDPKISNVEISITPFFVNTISNLQNNIIFEIEE